MVNEFHEFNTVRENNTTIQETILKNPYVQVQELVQTTTISEISPTDIIGIIFLFRKDDIVDCVFPCEGIEIAFLLQY